jgi:hypothetical protein
MSSRFFGALKTPLMMSIVTRGMAKSFGEPRDCGTEPNALRGQRWLVQRVKQPATEREVE